MVRSYAAAYMARFHLTSAAASCLWELADLQPLDEAPAAEPLSTTVTEQVPVHITETD